MCLFSTLWRAAWGWWWTQNRRISSRPSADSRWRCRGSSTEKNPTSSTPTSATWKWVADTHAHTHTRTPAHTHTCTHAHLHTHTHTRAPAQTHTHTPTHTHTHTHTCTNTHTYTYTHTHLHTHTHTPARTHTRASTPSKPSRFMFHIASTPTFLIYPAIIWIIKGLVYPKILDSSSCYVRPVRFPFFCGTQKVMLGKMFRLPQKWHKSIKKSRPSNFSNDIFFDLKDLIFCSDRNLVEIWKLWNHEIDYICPSKCYND